ncbi:beta-lactamase [Asticcacaulis sp. AC460]|uniref:serine hydrolase domain-containing protein n=1 Tax=Asticcacaulis sp. AC460 TaxID=1282360 RepID=UPI0003C3E664|nr:serine hydrolase domain-containing protein [Asticcacaulis sp. AC460]ESQ86875.1 beta-lactamase [Asticcacaulis sp. AC460]
MGSALALALILAAGPAVPQDAAPTAAAAPPTATPAAEATLKPYVPSSASASSSSAPKPKPKPKPATATAGSSSSAAASPSGPSYLQPVAATPAPQPVVAAPAPAATPVVDTAPVALNAPISADDIETFTDSVVRALMQRDHVLGATVAVVQGNTPLLVKGYGYDRLSPARRVDPNTSMFRVGSVTKTFTWIVARQEMEAGRIGLETPVGQHVPADVFAERGVYKPLTLRNLMSHTGGFEDTSLGHLFQLNGAQLSGPDGYFRRHTPRQVRAPGEFSSYSNFGVALAATALSQTAQAKDVPSLMEARIFQPLGMDHTTLREPYATGPADIQNLPAPLAANLTSALSDGFIWDGATYKAQPFDHAIAMSGALGGSTTSRDMARLMSVMLANGQADGISLYNADSARAFRTPLLKMPEGYNGWASGLMVRTSPSGLVTYGHSGATLWFNSNLVIVPEMNLAIFISTNTQSGGDLAESFPDLLLDHLQGDLVRPPLMPTQAQAYAANKRYYDSLRGHYVSTRRAYGGLEGAITRLINTVEVTVDGDGRLILTTEDGISAFVPASAQDFFNPQDSEGSGPAGKLGGLHFLFPKAGAKAKSFETASNLMRYERVGWIHKPGTLHLLTGIMVGICILVWVSVVRGMTRNERPTEAQARASLVSAGLSLAWLAAIFTFNAWQGSLAEDPGKLFTHWPSGQVQLASWLAIVGTLGTLYQVATFYFVANETQRFSVSEGWALWQKLAHGLLLGYWVFYAIVLAWWGALMPV